MKNIIILIVLLCFMHNNRIHAQMKAELTDGNDPGLSIEKLSKKKRFNFKLPYRVWVVSNNNGEIRRGFLMKAEKDFIVVSNTMKTNSEKYRTETIPLESIEMIKLHKRGRLVKSTLFGCLIGGTVGLASLYLIDRNKEECSGCMFSDGLLAFMAASTVGTITGFVIGLTKVKIPLNGNRKKYKDKLGNYSF